MCGIRNAREYKKGRIGKGMEYPVRVSVSEGVISERTEKNKGCRDSASVWEGAACTCGNIQYM